jgi:hypothetical protein
LVLHQAAAGRVEAPNRAIATVDEERVRLQSWQPRSFTPFFPDVIDALGADAVAVIHDIWLQQVPAPARRAEPRRLSTARSATAAPTAGTLPTPIATATSAEVVYKIVSA